VEHIYSWEANNRAFSQEITRLVWNTCSQESAIGPFPEPQEWNLHPHILCLLRPILKLSSHLRLGLASCLFPPSFPTKIFYEFLVSILRATCPTHLIFLDFITLLVFDEEYGLWSSSHIFLHPSVTSCFFGPRIPHVSLPLMRDTELQTDM